MDTHPRALRALARVLVRYAAKGSAHLRPFWRALMERRLEAIAGDVEALLWALGCVWALRVERRIGKFHPVVNCALYLIGLCLGVNYLLTHLAWYGVPSAPPESFPVAVHECAKIAILTGLSALVGFLAPGRPRRRVFVACAFPLFGLLALWATAVGMELTSSIGWPPGYPAAGAVLRGVAFGLTVAAPLALPAVLLYRGTAAPVAVLALIPAIAKAAWSGAPGHADSYDADIFFWRLWPYLCALIVVTTFTCICHRSLSRTLEDAGRPPAR